METKQYVALKLKGPLMSWGGHTTEHERPTLDFPTLSAVAGLLGACFGVGRYDFENRRAILNGFRYAARLDMQKLGGSVLEPNVMVDFHTVQGTKAIKDKKTNHLPSLADVRELDDSVSQITRRHYLNDSQYTLVIEPSKDLAFEEILEATSAPVFVVRLGRKICLPSIPLCGKEVQAKSFMDAFSKVEPFAGTVCSPDDEGAYRFTVVRDIPELGTSRFWQRTVYLHRQEGKDDYDRSSADGQDAKLNP